MIDIANVLRITCEINFRPKQLSVPSRVWYETVLRLPERIERACSCGNSFALVSGNETGHFLFGSIS